MTSLREARHRIAFLRGIGRDLHTTDPNLAQTADDAHAFVEALDGLATEVGAIIAHPNITDAVKIERIKQRVSAVLSEDGDG